MNTKLSFFHQKRRDLAFRTGIEVNEERVLERYIPGNEDKDSSLLWYVDVRCLVSDTMAPDAAAAKAFFINMAGPIKAALLSGAEELRAGLDADVWPMIRAVERLPSGVKGEIVCSAMKRVADNELSDVLRELAANWTETLNQLHETVASA